MTRIKAIASALPAREVTNEELDRDNPAWKMDLIVELTGIRSRRFVAPGETAYDLSRQACEELLANGQIDLSSIDAILCCTQHPDYRAPGNAHLLHADLGLKDQVLAFDYNLACSGFVYGLSIADSLVKSGTADNVLLVTADTPSMHINARDRSSRVVFGDGAAATLIVKDGESGGLIAAHEMLTHGKGFEHAYVPAGGARTPANENTKQETSDQSGNVRTAEDFHLEGTKLWGFVTSTVPGHIRSFLNSNGLSLDDIDIFVFHQASKMVLESLRKALGVPPEKLHWSLEQVGNLSPASVPFALKAALDDGTVKKGDLVLLSAFGAGISYGSVIVRY